LMYNDPNDNGIYGDNVDYKFATKDKENGWRGPYFDSPTIKQVNFPMLSDQNGSISREYGTYIESEGVSLRGTFLIDPNGVLKAIEIHNNSLGRSIPEIIRKIDAAQHIYKNSEQACPANWNPGNKALKPGLDMVGKI